MTPLVTCLCLTRNRREWLPKAIRYFQLQTYANRELLIVADGQPVQDLVPDDPRIRLVHVHEGLKIGQKRNEGVARAAGEIVAHWDDDDYSAPGRLQDQSDRLLCSGLAVTGYSAMFFTDGSEWWRYRVSKPFAFGTSLCYRKDWWERHPFVSEHIGEDSRFFNTAKDGDQFISCEAGLLMVASIHTGNTAKKHSTDGAPWFPVARPVGAHNPFD